MNRQQYMAALTEKLQGYPVSFREEVLENFASHFEEGQAMGKSDEEIIRELGPVEEVAEYVRQVTMGEVPEAQPEADGPETAWQEETPAGQKSGKLYGNIRSLVIESRRGGSVDVRLVPGAELEYQLEPAQDIYHAVSDMIAQINGLFGIRTENRNVPSGAVFERLEADRAVLTVEGTRGVLVVSVPACVKELTVSLTSGDIRVEGLTVEKTALKSVSGDITEKKNTMAVVYTLEKDPEFREKWAAYDGSPERVPEFVAMMERAGAPEYLQEKSLKYTKEAEETLALHRADNAYQALLDEVIASLADRKR